MNTTQHTALEQAALEVMLQEAVRNKNAELYRKLVSGSEEEVEALLDQWFR